jgi:capsular polysaccharide export protein
MTIAVFSNGIMKIPGLSAMLGAEVFVPNDADGVSRAQAAAGWGNKANTSKARGLAEQRGIPFVALEDGFIRSHGLEVHGARPLSIVFDLKGIYYDAAAPSDLEGMLNSEQLFPEPDLEDARLAMQRIVKHGISKYCCAPDLDVAYLQGQPGASRRVLVVDQTRGDLSVKHGGGDDSKFEAMLYAAAEENPDAQIWVKTHPDVIAGKRAGFLTSLAKKHGFPILAVDVNPYSVFPYFDMVYTVTSQMGFEALIAGKRVVCFGMPFYAGWGVTDDRMECSRRVARRSVQEIFAAAYLMYARYLNPVTGEQGTIFDVIEHMRMLRQRDESLSGKVFVLGLRRWQRALVLPFLKTPSNDVFFINEMRQAYKLGISKTSKVVVFGYSHYSSAQILSQQVHCKVMVMEDGFLRSVGLGSDQVAPSSLVVDTTGDGIYFSARTSSGLEKILEEGKFTPTVLYRAVTLRKKIVELGITKFNVGDVAPFVPVKQSSTQAVIFVPGQVESSSSVQFAAAEVRTNLDLLRAVRESHPDAYIVYKPHPDVVAGASIGGVPKAQLLKFCSHVEVDASCTSIIDAADEIHVISSQVGFDALLRGKKVVCFGAPFYAGWGLTEDRFPGYLRERRTAVRTIDELVAATLIMYPMYYDHVRKEICSPEVVVDLLARERATQLATTPAQPTLLTRLRRGLDRLKLEVGKVVA